MARKPTEVVIQIVPHCRDCQAPAQPPGVLLAMEPGVDGLPWYLCPACWVKGWKEAQPLRQKPIAIVG